MDLLGMSEKELIDLRRKQDVAWCFRTLPFCPTAPALENIAFPLQMRGMKRREYVERARKMIALVGLEGRENNFPRELSGGQQQRVGIARSLAVEPRHLVSRRAVLRARPRSSARRCRTSSCAFQSLLNKTIVFITHDFDEALKLADRIAIMFNGRIEQIGKPEDIVLKPRNRLRVQVHWRRPARKGAAGRVGHESARWRRGGGRPGRST